MKLRNNEVRIENTVKCNARCVMCPRDTLSRPIVTMPTSHFRNLVNQSVDLGANIISIFGYGEPLMDPGFSDKVAYASKFAKTFTTTNASLLSLSTANMILDAGLSRIRFSVHGINKAMYESIHSGLNWEKTFDNIIRFIELRDKKGYGCVVEFTTLLFDNIGPELVNKVIDFWDPYADALEIWKPHNWAYGKKYRKGNRKKRTCGRPFNGPLQINADGEMMICCFDIDAKMSVGSTYISSVEDIVKGEDYEEIRNRHRTGKLKGLPCENCDQLYEYIVSPLFYSSKWKMEDYSKSIHVNQKASSHAGKVELCSN